MIIESIKENETGRNTRFTVDGVEKTRAETVKIIEKTPDCGYHIRKINGIKTPVSNPDGLSINNIEK